MPYHKHSSKAAENKRIKSKMDTMENELDQVLGKDRDTRLGQGVAMHDEFA